MSAPLTPETLAELRELAAGGPCTLADRALGALKALPALLDAAEELERVKAGLILPWTSEPPAETGWYWFRDKYDARRKIDPCGPGHESGAKAVYVKVFEFGDGGHREARIMDGRVPSGVTEPGNLGLWCGPLTMPNTHEEASK